MPTESTSPGENMLRKAFLISVLTLFSSALAGCHLYFGDGEQDSENYQYCDDTGCYSCDDWGCTPEGGGEGWNCATNYECAAGCFCNTDGLCEEAGFCTSSNDCPESFECDDRSSCVPEGSNDACEADADCPRGSYCDEQAGACVGSWGCDQNSAADACGMGFECDQRGTCVPQACTDDGMCQEGCYCDEAAGECIETSTCDALGNCPGALLCDTDRNTCVPADEIGPTCQSEVVCDAVAPICPEGSTAVIESGCYTGQCMAKAECPDGAPFECRDLNNSESACIANAACGSVYKGVNCTSDTGAQCTSGSANCSCESFQFDYCEEI